ncbi:MAG: hypothetical protein ICV51_18830 [Flavisolibacter sp.]|nr:hypothetical protein [Flavisolibacter sp.]
MTVSEEKIDLSQLSSLKQFSSFLKREAIEQIARETGFICRNSSRLSGEAFLKMMVHTIMPRNEWSLTD